ncbi:MAG: hypothetical protein F4X51_15170 [Gemmatimonadetes bacterium]|nr:hypothetical protein [Gemmatimonadota bacterium]
MTTRRKLTLINGAIDAKGDIQIYRFTNSLEIGGCPSGSPVVPPVPFPDDDDWDDFEQAE